MSKVKGVENEELKSTEELAFELNITTIVLAGVKAMNGWKNGKQLTKSEFEKAIDRFLNKTI